MDDLGDRYGRLVAAFGATGQEIADPDRLAMDADALAAEADTTWLRVQARALAAAARGSTATEPDLATIVDATPPAIDGAAEERLQDLLPGGGPLADRLADHDEATSIPPDELRPVAERLLAVLRLRAVEDLELPIDHDLSLATVERPDEAWRARLEPGLLVLDASEAWTVELLVETISTQAYPGRHLARLMRPSAPQWSPSPETTVDHGLAAVGREILLADHELAHELERSGRDAGARWNGERIVAVGRARAEMARDLAAAALHDSSEAPLARARSLARAAGPPLVRAWLATTGQTMGLQRLLGERLLPTMLREEVADGGR